MKTPLMVVAIACLAGSALALQTAQKAGKNEIVLEGKVMAVSTEEATVTVKEIGEPPRDPSSSAMQTGVEREFVVTEATKLTAKGGAIQLGDIHAGDLVTVHFVLEDGKNLAKSITVRTKST